MSETIAKDLRFERIWRVGRKVTHSNRDIVIECTSSHDKAVVMRHIKNLRRGTRFFVSDQYPAEICERRRDLQKIRKQKIAEGKQVKLVADRLYVDGHFYCPTPPSDRMSFIRSIQLRWFVQKSSLRWELPFKVMPFN